MQEIFYGPRVKRNPSLHASRVREALRAGMGFVLRDGFEFKGGVGGVGSYQKDSPYVRSLLLIYIFYY